MKAFLTLLLASLVNLSAFGKNSKLILTLDHSQQDSQWYPLTDQLRFAEKGSTAFIEINFKKRVASFTGILKINQGAGFASIRKAQKINLSNYNKIEIPIKGDGRTYKVLLKDLSALQSLNDYSYQSEFSTIDNEIKTIILELKDFKPYYRGRLDLSLPELNTAEIYELGLQINDKIQGPYQLEFGEWTAVE